MNPWVSIPLTVLLILRSISRRSLTPLGLVFATLTALIHSLHPSPVPFTLLCTFFLIGTAATKIHHNKKATLTLSSGGESGGEGPRTHIQVLANSGIASLLCLLHAWRDGFHFSWSISDSARCVGFGNDLLLAGIVTNYAAVAADTLSSELGILASSQPRLITTLKTVPRGTNGGVTIEGLLAGALGSAVIALTSTVLGTFCPRRQSTKSFNVQTTNWSLQEKGRFTLAVVLVGTLGSVLDSLLGALLQASVIDRRTGKVVEGTGGMKVLFSHPSSSGSSTSTSPIQPMTPLQKMTRGGVNKFTKPSQPAAEQKGSRSINSGRDLLDNNQINILMASIMSVVGMVLASTIWHVPLSSIWTYS